MEVESKNPSLFKVLIQNVKHCILHGEPKDSKMQWSPNVVYIKISPPEKHKQPQNPNLYPPPVYRTIENLLKEVLNPLNSYSHCCLDFQLEVSKRQLNPNPNFTPNLQPNNQPNPPGYPKPKKYQWQSSS